MKRIIYTFFLGMLCTLVSLAQPFNNVLSTAQTGNVTNQARNSIIMAAGYSYTPNGGSMLAEIVNPITSGVVSYASVVNPINYSIDASLPVGKTKGELQVNGSSNYIVPIDLPRGTAGLQPNISLNYQSNFNDGLLGLGWNIGGLSSISRVGQNLYFETQAQPIKGDLTDKYLLDGKRLICTSGSYGSSNSIYGTEIEEFSKITANDATTQGPAWFEVRTKSGLICEYGKTTDSKVLLDGTCVLTWKINKITDLYGNYITFTYFDGKDERPILQIDYTGNGTSVSPFAHIYFGYKERLDVSNYICGGKEFTNDLLLDYIEIKKNDLRFKKYQMEYCQVDNSTQLQKVTEYNQLNPMVFVYSDQTEQFTNTTHYTNTVKERFYQGDFNGDGRTDFVTIPVKTSYTSSDKWKLYTGSSTGQMSTVIAEGYLDASFKAFQSADMDGDGLCDLIRFNQYNLAFYKSTGSNFTANPSILSFDYSTDKINIVDYNGDGKLEILIMTKGTQGYWEFGIWFEGSPAHYRLYSSSGSLICQDDLDLFGNPGAETAPKPGSGTNQIIDFNGDGCSDILVLFSDRYELYEFKNINNNRLIQTSNGTNLKSSHSLIFGDFNGDGKTDIVRAGGPVQAGWSMATRTKDGFKDHEILGFSNFNLYSDNNRWNSCDINGDGKTDIVLWGKGQNTNNSTNRINVAINKGNGYEYSLTEYTSPVNFNIAYKTRNPNVLWEDYEGTSFSYFGDYNGDGREEFFYRETTVNSKLFSFASGTPSNLLYIIIDGLGAETHILYKPMSNSTIYTRGTNAVYPLCDFSSGMQLVSGVYTFSDSKQTPMFSTTYNYESAKIHLKGKGFLGFTKTTQTNGDTEIFTENNYSFDTLYYYPKLMTSYTKLGNNAISTVSNAWLESTFNESNHIFPYVSSSTQTDNLKSLSITSSVVYPASNLYGNPTSITKSYSPGSSKTTSFTYGDERVGDWLIGRPTNITEVSNLGSDSQTYAISRTYFSTNNSPDIDQNNSGDGSWWQLNRDYDGFGNLWKEHKATTGLTETHLIYDYDGNGVNLVKTTDQVGRETSYTWYPTTGLLNTQTDAFGNVVTYTYNTADQLSTVVPSSGISTTITSSFNVTGGPTNASHYVDKTGNDGSQTKIWYDRLGRELRTETRKFGGTLVKVDKQYNTKGELAQYSEPTTGTPSSWNVVGHDNYGRVNSLDPIFGPTTTYSEPSGNPTTTRTVNGRNYKTTIDAAGQVISTEDPGGIITNNYWPNGLLKSTLAPGSITTSMTYDKNGNRLTLTDPSAGSIANTWYGTGQPKTTVNADGQTTTYTYFADQKVQLQNSNTPGDGQTSYTYYTNGLVNTVTSPNNVTRSHTYELGKVKTITEAIDGVSNLVTFEYDSKGRLFKKYFNGTTEYEQYDYDTNSGYLYRIQFTAAGSTATVWQLTDMDQYQRITQAAIGSTGSAWSYDTGSNLLSGISASGVQGYSYAFDANTGNLNSRTNSLRSKTDNFGYDIENLDRLTSVTGSTSPAVSVAYTTNKNGNIETKSDAGTYVYDATQPYAVDQITGGLNISNDQQTIDYYSFEKVKKITEGEGATQKTADFDYNADLQRIRMVLKTNGTVTKARYYFGGSCEREVVAGVTIQYIWIGGDAYSAVAVAKRVGTGSWTVYDIFRDHLGTITHLKNGINTADEYSFDAWGRRRDKDDWTYTLTSEPALFADRGFTGHEYLEDFKLYNMNGRLYDPVVGRFLSADPVIQDPTFTQNYNRYSYCLNNPLKFTDPSGNTWWDKFWNWTAEKGIQFGINIGSSGPVPNINAPGPGNTRIGVGVNTKTGQVGVGNNSSGFMDFYFPTFNYNTPEENALASIDITRAVWGNDWKAASGGVITAVWGPGGNSLGETVNNFLGIKGLTSNDLYWYSKKDGYGWGGLKINLSYTSNDAKTGYQWIQKYSENGGSWTFDNKTSDGQYSGSIAYYSPQELAEQINGNTISFYDAPRSPANNDSFKFVLSLYNGSNRVFAIYYGYKNVNGVTTPYYPKAVYP